VESLPVWPLTHFVASHGLDHPDAALDALAEMTRRFTAEFALRPFLLRHPDRTLARLAAWSRSPDQHLRRAASEASRPRLPWGIRLAPYVADPEPVIRLITPLRADPEPYVRRSVANNLNDIAKDHPERVLAIAEAWWAEGSADTRALVRHALRTLIKAGHPRALGLLGYTVPARVVVEDLRLSRPVITLGETQELTCTLRSTADAPQRLLVDFLLGMARARGRRGEKVFKGRQLTLSPRGSDRLVFRLPLRAVTTRRYYAGLHSLRLLVCGERRESLSFELRLP
jgi:3-methyladenine DNA glycosylase AlkC